MYEQVYENLRKATASSIQMQQEMFQKWSSLFPGQAQPMAAAATAMDEAARLQSKWEEVVTDMLKRQKELVDTQYRAGLKTLEEMFRVGQAKSPEEIQQRVLELYRTSFESLRQLSESQMKDFKAVVDRWTELMTKAV
jgi:hypothetical protein